MNKRWIAIAITAGLATAATTAVQAQTAGTGLLVRARAVYISPADKDSIAITDISISKKTIPEVDFTYFFTPNLAAELVLTYPQEHDVSSSAHGGKIGTLKHLPPVLSAQYHFTDLGAFKPYLGVGLNYTIFSDVNLPSGFTIDKHSTGLSLQGGFDYAIDKQWSLNFDLKKVKIQTDLYSNGTNLGTIKVDPWLVGFGVGYRF